MELVNFSSSIFLKLIFRTNENPIHYKVQIASGERVPTIQKDETVEIRLNGRNQERFSHWSTELTLWLVDNFKQEGNRSKSTRWIRIFASFKVNTFETFEYAEKDIGDIDEVSIRIRNIDSGLVFLISDWLKYRRIRNHQTS